MNLPIKHISASSLNQWDACPACWALKYIDKKKPPEYEPFIVGKKCHQHVDNYHKGKPYDKEFIHSYIQVYPQDYRHTSEVFIHRPIHYKEWKCPIPVVGIVDGFRDKEIVDLKYAKNKPKTEKNYQGILYSWLYWLRHKDFPLMTFNWVNKVNHQVKNISVTYTEEDIKFLRDRIDLFIEQIQQPRAVIDIQPHRPYMNNHFRECPNAERVQE